MFGLIADLVRGWGLPWSGAGFLVIVAILLFVLLRVALYIALYGSYLVVIGIRRANRQLPGVIYSAELAVCKMRERLKAGLWISAILVGAWVWLYLARVELEGEQLVKLERKVTSVVAGWVGSEPQGTNELN